MYSFVSKVLVTTWANSVGRELPGNDRKCITLDGFDGAKWTV